MAKQTIYVPVLSVLDYNDEYYYEIEGDAVSIGTQAYSTEQAAFTVLLERFKASWCKHGETISDFEYDSETISNLQTHLKKHVETDAQLKLIDEIDKYWTIKRLVEEFGDEEFFRWSNREFISFGYVQELCLED